ncbi:MAG: hypothetical protein QM489_01115 [Candidatus Izemoplasma sp.]
MTQENKFTELDFFAIKQKLINNFQAQTEFQDVNFLGSTANIIVDTCAYAIHQMAFHANFAISETFLDSVQKRANALSRAKELGYPMATVSSSVMRVVVEVSNLLPADPDILLPKFENFNAKSTDSSGKSIAFVNTEAITLVKETNELGEFIDETKRKAIFDIWQGRQTSRTFSFDATQEFGKYSLLDDNIDGKTVQVSVDGAEWNVYDGINSIDPDSNIFYIQENALGNIEIWFGDGILSKKPINGAEIIVDYLISIGEDGNDVATISYPVKSSDSDWEVSITEISQGGAPEHTTHRIATTAPIVFAAQKRAVTKTDYEGLLKAEFSWIETLAVWGGEDNDPPIYGRVFVSIKPKGSEFLSSSLAQQVEDRVLNKYNVLGIPAEITEPDYVYIDLSSEVFWDPSLTREDASTLLNTFVLTDIDTFFINNVTEFNKKMKYSKLVAAIDDSHNAISHNITTLNLSKKFKPIPFSNLTTEYNFRNPIQSGTFTSNPISIIGGSTITLKDNGNGSIDEYLGNNVRSFGIGTINYKTGSIVLSNYKFEVENSTEVIFNAKPANQDIEIKNNALLVLGTKTATMSRV